MSNESWEIKLSPSELRASQGDNILDRAISFPEHAILGKEHKALG
jgi:hypothetical protein